MQYYTLKQASEKLGESIQTLRRRIRAGLLEAKPGVHPNSPYRIKSLDLARYQNARDRGELCDARR